MHTRGEEWGNLEELMALLVEKVDLGNRIAYSSTSGEEPPWRPLSIPRPHEPIDPGPRKMSSGAELVRFFGGAVKVDG